MKVRPKSPIHQDQTHKFEKVTTGHIFRVIHRVILTARVNKSKGKIIHIIQQNLLNNVSNWTIIFNSIVQT